MQVKKIIGLVEDDQTIATVVSSLLEEEGYQVVRMSMAEELFRFFRDRTADLILLDYRLPDMEGKDLLRKLRPQEKAPVIVISADHSVKEVSLQAG
ncbi:MAG TPA: response regulator, partial [Patescibacteria group bacterium]|nr:response regulator [Patescibacteria group bacterium]